MKIEKVKINSITENPDNPRTIKGEKFNKLVKSIKDFPEMLKIRPIVVNDDNVILGGNMRYKASIRAGLSEVHIIRASGLTDEQQKEFIAKDNVGFGEWYWDVLANDWDVEKLEDWGIEVPSLNDFMDEHEPEIEFSEFLDESNNYVVLFFKNDIDWLQAQTHFSLKSVSSKRSNGKAWSKGIGRVINGAEYLNKK